MNRVQRHKTRGIVLALFVLLPLQCFWAPASQAATDTNDIYAMVEIADKAMDVVLRKAKGVKKVASPTINETQLGAMHAYQLHIACLDQLRSLEIKLKLRPFPKIVASPNYYKAEDVYQLSAILLSEVRRIAIHLNIWGMPEVDHNYTTKNYNDVVRRCLAVFMKLRTLEDMDKISTNGVYPQFPRGVSDIKTILTHIDPAQRYRIDLEQKETKASLADVHRECLNLRHDLNKLRKFYNLRTVAVPKKPPHTPLHPCDIYIQTQIILAEINALKKASGTYSISPEGIPTKGKNAADLLYQAQLLRYLANQIPSLTHMVK